MFGSSKLFDHHKAGKKGLSGRKDYSKAYRDFFGTKVLLNSSNPDTFFVADAKSGKVCMVTVYENADTDEDELRQALTNWDYFSELAGRSDQHYRVPDLKMGVYDRQTKEIKIVTGPVRGIVLDELKMGILTAVTLGHGSSDRGKIHDRGVQMVFFKGIVAGIVDLVSTLHELGHVHRTVHPGRFAIEVLAENNESSLYRMEDEDRFAKFYTDKLAKRLHLLQNSLAVSARGGRTSVAPVRFEFSCGFSRRCLFSTSETDVYRTPQEWRYHQELPDNPFFEFGLAKRSDVTCVGLTIMSLLLDVSQFEMSSDAWKALSEAEVDAALDGIRDTFRDSQNFLFDSAPWKEAVLSLLDPRREDTADLLKGVRDATEELFEKE